MKSRAPFLAATALLAVGAVTGTLEDVAPARPAVHRGGYRVLSGDFHAHTRFSDGLLSPFSLVLQGRRRGLDVLAITEHNNTFPAEIGRWFAQHVDSAPMILVGEEVTTDRYHVHGIGLTARLDASRPLTEVLDEVHRQGGVTIAAHPIAHFHPAFDAVLDRLDATELMHPIAYGGGTWRWEEMRDFYERSSARGRKLTAIGSSDYHFASPLGICRTLLFVDAEGPEAVLDAIRAGRTVVHDLQGNAYGDPAMIEALRSTKPARA